LTGATNRIHSSIGFSGKGDAGRRIIDPIAFGGSGGNDSLQIIISDPYLGSLDGRW
jgi:hypothetical protein